LNVGAARVAAARQGRPNGGGNRPRVLARTGLPGGGSDYRAAGARRPRIPLRVSGGGGAGARVSLATSPLSCVLAHIRSKRWTVGYDEVGGI